MDKDSQYIGAGLELLPSCRFCVYAFDLSPFGFLLFFPKRKKGAGTLCEIPAPFLNSENEKSTYLLVSKTSGQVPLSCYKIFWYIKTAPFLKCKIKKGAGIFSENKRFESCQCLKSVTGDLLFQS
ncbi:MAG: hypothetical protein V8Q30_04865 [Acutalibacteraceae bacterium]